MHMDNKRFVHNVIFYYSQSMQIWGNSRNFKFHNVEVLTVWLCDEFNLLLLIRLITCNHQDL